MLGQMMSNNNDGETTNVIATSSNAGVARAGARAGNLSPVPDGREDTSTKYRGWTKELDLALLEEVGNCGAHTPGHNQATKCWENVLAALKSRGMPFDNHRTVQRRFIVLKEKFIKKMADQEATAGIEDFGDDDDPFTQAMEDLVEEMRDFEAEKSQKREEKKNREESLVAGGQKLRDKAAQQILGGVPVAVGCLRPSPTSSMSDADVAGVKSKEPSTSSVAKKSPSHLFEDYDLAEHENKKMEIEARKLELEAKKFESEMELKREEYRQNSLRFQREMELKREEYEQNMLRFRAEMEFKRDQHQQNLAFHHDSMELKKKEIDTQHQALQLQVTKHQDEMRMKFMEMEQRMKGFGK